MGGILEDELRCPYLDMKLLCNQIILKRIE